MGRDRVLSVDVGDQDTWDMIYYHEFVKRKKKMKKKDERESESRG